MAIINPPADANYTSLVKARDNTLKRYLIPQNPSKHELLVHTVATVVIFGAIITIALALSHHLTSFPQDFIHAFSQPKALIALSITAAAVTGGLVVIRNIVCNKDNGKFSGKAHWKPAFITNNFGTFSPNENQEIIEAIRSRPIEDPIQIIQEVYKRIATANSWQILELIDTRAIFIIDDLRELGLNDSRLEQAQKKLLEKKPFVYESQGFLDTSTAHTKQCAFYIRKEPIDNEYVATAVIATAPIHVVATIANNILRLLIVPLKLTFSGNFRQIPAELKADVWRAVRAPFYGVAVIMAAIYMWVDPRNGLKLVAAIENKWNDGVPLHESAWAAPICTGCFSLCVLSPFLGKVVVDAFKKWSIGGGLYVAGCAQKQAIATLDATNTITTMTGYPCFFIPENMKSRNYLIFFRE